MTNKTILKHRNLILEEMIEENKNIEDIFIYISWTKQKLIESGLSDTKVIDEVISELKNKNRNVTLIKSKLDTLDNLIESL